MSFTQVSLAPELATCSFNKPAIVFLNEQKFELGCIVSYMEGAFPEINVIGISDPQESRALSSQQVALAVIAVPSWQMGLSARSHGIEQIAAHFPEAAIAIAVHANQNCDSILNDIPGLRGIFPTSLSPAVVAAIIRVIIAGGDYFHRSGYTASAEQTALVMRSPGLPHAVSVSEVTQHHTAARHEASDDAAPNAPAAIPRFTTRETQILQKLAEGLQNKLIAASLAMPENTVKIHVRNIMRKLKSTNRTAAVIAAQRLNVILRH